MRRVTYYPIFAILWLIFSILGMLTGRHDPTRMLFFGCMVAVAAVASIYLMILAYAPRVLFRTGIGSRCPSCYCRIRNGDDFCPKCGSIVNETAFVKCPSCGTSVNDPNKEFCPKCGTILKK